MRGVPVPDHEDDFSADASELFFDLVYVFAFSRLVGYLAHHPDLDGAADALLLFTMIWLPWTQFTWSANAVAGNTRPVRLLLLVASVASVPMAASISTALGPGGPAFAISLSVILAMGLLTMIVPMVDHPEVRRSILRYSVPNWIAIALFVGGGFADADTRPALWFAGIAVVIWGTIRAGRSEWLVRPAHFAERHGLILIVALGEVIVALGSPLADGLEEGAGLPGDALGALVAAGAFACLLWWGYFDRASPALEHQHTLLEGGQLRGRFARDVYTYAMYPLIGGVILAVAGLEPITQHPGEAVPVAARWMLFGGVALYLAAIAIAVGRAFHLVAVERVAAIAVLGALLWGGGERSGIALLAAVDVVLAAMLLVEHLRVEVRHRPVPSASASP